MNFPPFRATFLLTRGIADLTLDPQGKLATGPIQFLPYLLFPCLLCKLTEHSKQLYERLLVLRLRLGDEHAFEEVVGMYGPRLYYYVRKILGEETEAADVMQDVWLDVFRSASRLKAPEAFRSWLYRIARDRAFRLLRRRRPQSLPLEELELAVVEEDADDFTAEQAEEIHAALDELPPEQRDILVLRFLEEMSYEDIARVTGVKLGTVRSRIHYAKRALRNLLSQVPQNPFRQESES